MGIFKNAPQSENDVFVQFESAINLETRGQINLGRSRLVLPFFGRFEAE